MKEIFEKVKGMNPRALAVLSGVLLIVVLAGSLMVLSVVPEDVMVVNAMSTGSGGNLNMEYNQPAVVGDPATIDYNQPAVGGESLWNSLTPAQQVLFGTEDNFINGIIPQTQVQIGGDPLTDLNAGGYNPDVGLTLSEWEATQVGGGSPQVDISTENDEGGGVGDCGGCTVQPYDANPSQPSYTVQSLDGTIEVIEAR